MRITYKEFITGNINFDKKLDKEILKALKNYAMQVKDVILIINDMFKQSYYRQTPYSFRISARLQFLKYNKKVTMKKINNKYFWGLKK